MGITDTIKEAVSSMKKGPAKKKEPVYETNRATRRRHARFERGSSKSEKRYTADSVARFRKKQREQKVERRVARAQLRKKEREEARLAGKPVVYSGEKNKKPFISKRSQKMKK